jgi:hypothetical protein
MTDRCSSLRRPHVGRRMTRLPMHRTRAHAALLTLLTCSVHAGAQERGLPFQAGFVGSERRGDVEEWTLSGGVRFVDPALGLDLRCDRALLVLDAQESAVVLRDIERASGLPTRFPSPPASRRSVDADVIRSRLAAFIGALSRGNRGDERTGSLPDTSAFRSLYLEGEVSVIREGIEVLRADSVYLAPADDRATLRGVTLRLRDQDTTKNQVTVTVRATRLDREKGRFVGRDVSVTTCPAGAPQFEVRSGELEIIEGASAFEIRSRDNVLALFQSRVLPLPDQVWRTDEQTNFPVKSFSVGDSSREGMRVGMTVGGTMNETGGRLHEWLTGRPADGFRGEWTVGTQWIEKRGVPLDATFTYRGDDVYRGSALGFTLSDEGRNIRNIRRDLAGDVIDNQERRVAWTENRLQLGDKTTVDLTVFEASDPAVWSEFYRGRYYTDERPETSLHARHGDDNWLVTATGRFNLTSFSYDSSRRLTEKFSEELPLVTFDWFSEPLVELPFGTPLTLTTSTGIGQLRNRFDDTVIDPPDEESFRIDQLVELAAPFHAGPIAVRPYATTRFTYYDQTVASGAEGRYAAGAGIEVGTRMARTWRYAREDGGTEAIRHVLSPTVRFANQFQVSEDPSDFFQFDRVDAVEEGAHIRVGLLQRLQRSTTNLEGEREIRDIAWVDLAQNFRPLADAPDRSRRHLGLFEFECILRPIRVSEQVRIGLSTEGEHDWQENDLRTFNNRLDIRTGETSWYGQYRSDRTERGQIVYGLTVPTRSRWTLGGYGVYSLAQSDHIRFGTQLARRDLNWTIRVGLVYDQITDDTSLRVLFEPALGGVLSPRGMWSGLADPFLGLDPLQY